MKARLILIAIGVAGLASATTITQTLSLAGGGTFLARSSNDNTQPGAFYTPIDFDLASLGLVAGDTIQVTFNGASFCYIGATICGSPQLLGLFSTSSSPSTSIDDANGFAAVTTNEFYNSVGGTPGPDNTNPNDFSVTNGLIFNIPSGGTNLFVGILDSFYSDNTGNISVTLTQITGVPEPAAYILTLAGLAAVAVRKRFTKS